MTTKRTIPPAPPPSVLEEDDVDPANNSNVKRLWDIVAVYGPISRKDLIQHRPSSSGDYREYVRYHPEVRGNSSSAVMHAAERWNFDRTIDLGVARGWLTEADGVVAIAKAPPGHTALATIGGPAQVAVQLTHLDSKRALEILIAKTDLAHMKVNRSKEGYKELERSLLRPLGQLEDVVIWHPHPMAHPEPIIVNGATRMEILTKHGIPVRTRELPRETPASEVLAMRIEYEVAGTSKDYSEKGRNDYMVQLAKAGLNHSEIAKQVGLSRARVQAILSQVLVDKHLGQAVPGEADVQEFVDLRDAGYTLRDIAAETQWSKNTVQRHLEKRDAGKATGTQPKNRRDGLKPDSQQAQFLAELADRGTATEGEILAATDLNRRGGHLAKLFRDKKGLIRVVSGSVGRGGDPAVYALTDEGREALTEIDYQPKARPKPVPKVAPVLSIVPPLPDLDQKLAEAGFTWEQIAQLVDIADACGVPWGDLPPRSRKAARTNNA